MERSGGVSAVKPSGFNLTGTQLTVRRSGSRLSNNHCTSVLCADILLWFTGHFHQVFANHSPHKGWISFHNHVTYAHNSGIRRCIYGKSTLSIPYSPLMDWYFYTSTDRWFKNLYQDGYALPHLPIRIKKNQWTRKRNSTRCSTPLRVTGFWHRFRIGRTIRMERHRTFHVRLEKVRLHHGLNTPLF